MSCRWFRCCDDGSGGGLFLMVEDGGAGDGML